MCWCFMLVVVRGHDVGWPWVVGRGSWVVAVAVGGGGGGEW